MPREPGGGLCFGVGGSCDLGDVISTIALVLVFIVAITSIATLVFYLSVSYIRDQFPSRVEESRERRRVSKGIGGESESSRGLVRASSPQQGRREPGEALDSRAAGETLRLSSAWRPARPRVSRAAEERQIQLRIEQGRNYAEESRADATRGHVLRRRPGQSESLEEQKERLRRETNRWLPGYLRRSRDVLE